MGVMISLGCWRCGCCRVKAGTSEPYCVSKQEQPSLDSGVQSMVQCVTLAAGARAEMGLRKARAGGVRGRAGCEGYRVSHLAAQTLGSEGAGVLGPARPGSTRHKATLWEEAGPWHHASPTPPVPQEQGWSPRRNVAWNLSKCGRMVGSGVWKPDGGEGQSAFLPLLPTPFC